MLRQSNESTIYLKRMRLTSIDGVPVPKHLEKINSELVEISIICARLTEILHAFPLPIPMPSISMLLEAEAIFAAVVGVGVIVIDIDECMSMVASNRPNS